MTTVERLSARAFTVPTDAPEADGTAAWDATTIVVVEATVDGRRIALGDASQPRWV